MWLQEGFNIIRVDGIVLIIDDLSCGSNPPSPVLVVDPSQRLPLCYVKSHPHVLDASAGYKTSRAKTVSFITDAGEKNSVAHTVRTRFARE
jgi:hypothetical protein